MRHQKGGLLWDQGDDGCIFKPPIACANKKVSLPEGKQYISKVVVKDPPDLQVEEFLKKHFLHVFLNKGILVASEVCVPMFQPSDFTVSEKVRSKLINTGGRYGGCLPFVKNTKPNSTNFVNLIYEEYDDSYFNAIQKEPYLSSPTKCFDLLRHALNAAIALVPDEGPWVLHIDSQVNNIFVKTEKYSTLADWGRCCIIENPKDLASIQKGLGSLLAQLKKKITVKRKPIETFLEYPELPQFSSKIREAYDKLLNTKSLDKDAMAFINLLRLTTVYGILNSFADKVNKLEGESYKKLKETLVPLIQMILGKLTNPSAPSSQRGIIDILNANMKEGYINISRFFPIKPPRVSVTNAPGAGAGNPLSKGGKRTRKQKPRKLSRHQTKKGI